jgi:PAS domain S-box-containing protein
MADQDNPRSALEQSGQSDRSPADSSSRQHQAMQKRAHDSEEMFRLLVENVKDYAIFMLDTEGRVAGWNAGAERIKGYRADEIIGKHFSTFYTQPDIDRGWPEEELRIAREQGSIENEGWRVRKDGSLFWADVVITAIYDQSHQLRGYAKVTRDITERKKAEETQRALFDQRAARIQAEEEAKAAQAANRSKDEFIALVSHELRNPLTSILGWARMLRMGRLDPDTTIEALDALERSAETQVHLVEDLLDSARVASGKLRLEKRPLDVTAIVEAAIADITPAAASKHITISKDLNGPCRILGDQTRLQQVVWNILSNAIKFTPEHGTVSVRLDRSGSTAIIEIRDTGRGMSADLLPRLFTRFHQGDPAAKDRRGGLGLGLSLARHLTEQHGGEIHAASDGPGKGSVFTIRLPLAAEGPEVFTARDSERTSALPRLDNVRVLIVEDEADTREMLATVALQCGAEVLTKSTAMEAVDALSQWRPDVVVCDIVLPDHDGIWLLKRIRASSPVPAMALTVLDSLSQEAKIRAAGFDVFRQKPIEPSDFAHEIARMVAQSKTGSVQR